MYTNFIHFTVDKIQKFSTISKMQVNLKRNEQMACLISYDNYYI